MKRFFYILAVIIFCCESMYAEEVMIGGLYYDLDNKSKTAAVVTNPSRRLNGDVVIPPTITYNGNTFIVKEIRGYAFMGQHYVESITIPYSVKKIDEWAFVGCLYVKNYYVHSANEDFTDINGVLFNKEKTKIIFYPPGKSNSRYSIPNGVILVGTYCFQYCENLVHISLPNTIAYIQGLAFGGCKNLESIYLPRSVQNIGYGTFSDCVSLKEIRYPRGLYIADAQVPTSTKLIPYDIEPPLLALATGSLSFSDPTQNNYIDANEKCTIKFKIQNKGKGAAQNCEARVKMSGATSGISVHTIKLPEIAVGQTCEVSIPITSNTSTENGKVTFSIEVYEPNGWGVAPFDLAVATKAFEAPLIQVVDYKITSNSGNIRKMEPFTLTFNLQNTKYGDAENVKVKINIPSNVFVMDGSSELSYPIIKSGETKSIKISLAANNNYAATDIPIAISINEKYGKYAENKQLSLALNQVVPNSYHIDGKDEKPQRNEIKLATLRSDIDKNIPSSQTQNYSTLVLVIANENYHSMPQVPYAINDGNIFKEYCNKTLGIPNDNIMCITNATLNDIRQKVELLQKKVQARSNAKKETNIIVYYTGHGVPDGNTRSAYLMPIDGYEENVNTGYKLDNLYQQLGQLPAKSITVFLDACFSGVNRNDEALAQHKGARLVAKSGMPTGNMVVFAASQGNQTAFVNDKEQDSKGDATLDELANYLTTEVNLKSLDLHEKEQIPSIIASPQVQNQWQNWKLK